MKRPRRPLLSALLGAALFAAATLAVPGPGPRAEATAGQADLVSRVEAYLNSIRTMRSRFLQIGPSGEVSRGTVLISRPGKLRIEYDPPSPVLILTESNYLMLYDKDLQSRSYASLDDSLAGFLVRPKIRLSGDVALRKLEETRGIVRLTLAQADSPEAGTLTLVFDDGPLSLRQWVVVDGQGGETRVSLENPRFNIKLDPERFEFTPPDTEDYPK
jgi:outer membrane lipoprotein-sorting protein